MPCHPPCHTIPYHTLPYHTIHETEVALFLLQILDCDLRRVLHPAPESAGGGKHISNHDVFRQLETPTVTRAMLWCVIDEKGSAVD